MRQPFLGRRQDEGRAQRSSARTAKPLSANSVRDSAHGAAITEPHPRLQGDCKPVVLTKRH
jgi:hypothetical protein